MSDAPDRSVERAAAIRSGGDNPLSSYNDDAVAYWVSDARVASKLLRGEQIRVWRTTGVSGIRDGDYVSTDRAYAIKHGRIHLKQPKTYSRLAFADELFPADAPREFIFVGRSK